MRRVLIIVSACLLMFGAAGLVAAEEVLFLEDFSNGDPLQQEPRDWVARNIPENASYTYFPEAGYVSFDGSDGGYSFGLETSAPRFLYWDRDLDQVYTVETVLRLDRANRFQSATVRLWAFNRGYSVVLGAWHDDYNVSLNRREAWDHQDQVVAHDGNTSVIFRDGAIQPQFKGDWVPVKMVLDGAQISVFVNDEEVISWVDPDPVVRFSFNIVGWVSGVSLDQVRITRGN